MKKCFGTNTMHAWHSYALPAVVEDVDNETCLRESSQASTKWDSPPLKVYDLGLST